MRASYQYFIMSINNEVHITRLCLSDNGDQPSPIGTFASHFDLELKCASSESATAAAFVNSTEPFGVETIVLAFQVTTSDTFHIWLCHPVGVLKEVDGVVLRSS